MLTSRHHEILKRVVQVHIEDGEPVGSKTVCERSGLGVSSATVRNAMMELEEMGLLTQPHPSAGRVPTDLGLRYYVDSLLELVSVSSEEQERILQACGQGNEELESVLARVSPLLATLTGSACLVRTPDLRHMLLRRVELIKLASRSGQERVLALLISTTGQLRSRVIFLQSALSQEKLNQFSLFLTRQLEGMTLLEVRERLQRELEQSEEEYRLLCSQLLASVSGLSMGGDLIVNGRMNLFQSFAELSRIREMLAVLEEKKGLLAVLDRCLDLQGVRLFIGSEAEWNQRGCVVVAAPFQSGEGSYPGTLGVLGPTRMDYAHVIPLIGFTTQVLSTLFAEGVPTGAAQGMVVNRFDAGEDGE
ncbi:heat-inducible transcriptional repressor HrcA [Candidatus Magnetaquicoccus inordinatus]|uniref:heat-inducible transcriptional repressor HrcA n=1 Tax=Candidatus Magnetaquicoccus inordinatus TaxID=2496818 RepID=UPI00102CA2AE|nr:heat-inducible transcriptional repressor HrcA [Candidatus Magnetaquicoccus inordinatus]